MSTTLFPMIQPETADSSTDVTEYPIFREVQWDYEKNEPVYQNGEPVIIEGAEAVKVWAWNALHTPRFRYEIYSWAYGNEMESLIGKQYSNELKQSEGARYVRECLTSNPYITDVKDISVSFGGDVLSISATLVTIYGEVDLSV